jgi:DNA-binding MarR family transcriptional regulator
MTADDSVKRFSRLLHDLTGLLKLLNRDEKLCYGLTWPQAFTVEALAAQGELTMSDLGAKMGVAVSTATRILDLLVRDGLVERKTGEHDRRQVLIALSEKGRDLARKLAVCREKAIGAMLAPLSAAKKKALLEAMETIKGVVAGSPSCC